MSSPISIMTAENLRREYGGAPRKLEILKGIQLTIYSGEMSFIVGRSGSGKSTLLHLLGGLDRPTAGKILFEGMDLAAMKERKLARIRNLRMGFVFQAYHLLPELTVYENVSLPARISGSINHGWIREILRRVNLTKRKNHYPAQLSGGEQQRAAIARALANKPSLVFCDEPMGNLDSETSEQVLSLITELNREEGQTFLIVTHDEALAWRYSNTYRLTDGVLYKDHRGSVAAQSAP